MSRFINRLWEILGLAARPVRSSVVPPFDLNKPVENPELVAAIAKHQASGSNETAVELFEQVKRAVFLVGMITPAPIQAIEGEALFKKGDLLGLITVLDNSDNKLLGLFTDQQQLVAFSSQATSTLVMPAKMALEATIRDGYSGLVINPASQATLRLDRDFILSIIGQFQTA